MERKKKPDPLILASIFCLFLIGILTVSSTSFVFGEKSKINFDIRHIFLSIFSFFFIIFLIAIDVRKFLKSNLNYILYFFSLLVLIGLYFQPAINNTHRFYKFPGFLIQPSEFIKILLVILTSMVLTQTESSKNALLYLTALILPPTLLILMQKDLGMTILILSTIFFMLLYKGISKKYLTLILIFSILLIFLSILSSPYQIKRVKEFVEGKSEDQISARIALGSGGLLGKGLGKSHQKFFYLSMPHTDFAFSILGEERGFVGSIILLACYFIIFYKGILLSTELEDEFFKLLVFGLVILFTLNGLIHISVNTGIVPAKGITLPLVSYGGSSMLSNSLLLGIILSISMRKQ